MGGVESTGSAELAGSPELAAGAGLEGSLECRRASEPPCLTLVGRDQGGNRVHLTLLGALPEDIPPRLDAASVTRLGAGRYEISAPGRAWELAALRAYLHYDLSEAFYRAVRPRRVPLAKRLFWRVVLAAAASRPGRRWLARRRLAASRSESPSPL